ncbi:MAG TPA: hypothetical protein DCS97_14315 [Planctomycetes bacterium]|nr:hypothetical protein [Planctomycetota bacterium]
MLEGFLISIPGVMVLLLGWCGWVLWRRRSRVRLAEGAGACVICKTTFAEAQITYHGEVTKAERAALDRFQARFATFKIHCHECGTINICTKDGQAFRALTGEGG